MTEDTDRTNAGVRKKGSWKEVADFGEAVEEAMEEAGMDEESVRRFQNWRPKEEEAENDMREKTVDQAAIDEKTVEEEENGVKDLKDASYKAAEAAGKTVRRENPEQEIKEASRDAVLPFLSNTIRLLRDLEQDIYSKIMLKFNPFYLDTDDFTVDFRSNGGGYEMDVSVQGKDSREKIQEELSGENE